MNFYPDIKPYISPSAFAQWHRQKSQFIRSYFKGERSPETAAMKAGTMIHGLIEAGFLEAIKRFTVHEKEIRLPLPNGVEVMGIPDSYGILEDNTVHFVDYKSGRENTWSKEALATDLKMLFTAYLVWRDTDQPEQVAGFIEYIPTEWNGKEVVPIEGVEHTIVECVYTAEQLQDFEKVIISTVEEINEAYPQFLESSDAFVNMDDCLAYDELEAKKKEIELQQEAIKERIAEQMKYGNVDTATTPFGTFYFRTTKKFDYPSNLAFKVGKKTYQLEEAEEIAAAASTAKKDFELKNKPVSVTQTLSFRAKAAPKGKKNAEKA